MSQPYDRLAERAAAMIAKYGAPVTWIKPAPQAEGANAWDDVRDGEPPTFNPPMVFFSVLDAGRGGTRGFFQAFMRGTEVPDANEVGFLAGNCGFEPDQSDTLIRSDGSNGEIVAIDKIQPSDTAVIYFVSVK